MASSDSVSDSTACRRLRVGVFFVGERDFDFLVLRFVGERGSRSDDDEPRISRKPAQNPSTLSVQDFSNSRSPEVNCRRTAEKKARWEIEERASTTAARALTERKTSVSITWVLRGQNASCRYRNGGAVSRSANRAHSARTIEERPGCASSRASIAAFGGHIAVRRQCVGL
ncbi:hypothetical protein EXIGLDRAFT_91843 [Exidia glandulosa HHB12029]|uniref:Uncharacterized protein n=1 Tax=Exidia glandulosa HHB12029 TaxID=1314781 RepID=A0A165H9E8_EXIGL|nr:hypothetical protein EXIGLDRAFT_91843 [Exidia glandulosa HHB12029]